MPDFFGHIRPLLCQTDGSPRLLVRVMPALVVYAFVAMALFINYMFGTVIPIATGGEPMAPLVRVMVLGWVAIFSLPGLFIPMLCRVIRVGGSLQLLGAGEKRVSAASLVTLQKWVWVSRLVAIVPCLYAAMMTVGLVGVVLAVVGVLSDEGEASNPLTAAGRQAGLEQQVSQFMLAVLPGMVVVGCGGFAAMACFFGSLKVAVCLARDDVTEVLKKTNHSALADDKLWAAEVARPAIALGTATMKHLSEGWGSGTGVGFVLCWIVSFTNFLVVIHNITEEAVGVRDPLAGSDPYDPTKHALTCIGMAVAPLLITADVAHVSSMCDTLLNTINSLRLEWASTDEANEVHSRTFPLQWTLKGLNNSQGLGFVVFSKVVDRKT